MNSSGVFLKWRALAIWMLSLGLAYMYLPTLIWLVREWWGGGSFAWVARDWSHGFLVVVLLGYLLWRRRLVFASTRGSWWGAPLLAGGLGLHVLGGYLASPYLSAYSLIPVALAVVWLLCGRSSAHSLLVPFLLFVLAVPFPSGEWGVTAFLARVVAAGAAPLSRVLGTPVSWSGQLITVGEDRYLIESLCSGFNLIMALLALVIPVLYLRGSSLKGLGMALLWLPALGMAVKIVLVSAVLRLTPWLGQDAALDLYHGWLGILAYAGGLAAAMFLTTVRGGRAGGGGDVPPAHSAAIATR